MKNRLVLVTAAGAALALAACGDDEKTASKDPAALTITASESGKKVNLEVTGDKTPGTTNVTFTNNGKKPHAAQLIAVTGEHSDAEVVAALKAVGEGKPAPAWFFAAGGAGSADPGKTNKAGLVLNEGTYYVADDEDDANLENGGLVKLPIAGDKNEAPLPTGGTVTAKDYSFTSSGLEAGANTVVFTNAGKEWHHMIAAPMNKGTTLADVKKFAETEGGGSGPPPIDFESAVGTSVIEGGGTITSTLDLKKGKYALLCFIADRKGGPPHVAKGMVAEATVQ